MKFPTNTPRKILIIGDSGRGKTTFAHRLSSILGIDSYSTDDFYWKTKYTEKQNPQVSLEAIKKNYQKDSWIVEGATANLIKEGFERADTIFRLEFETIASQWWSILRRHHGRKEERIQDLFLLLRHVFYKRYGIGYERGKPTIRQLVYPHATKEVVFRSFREIDNYLRSFEK